MPLNEEGFIDRVSLRHSVSPDAVRTRLRAFFVGGANHGPVQSCASGLVFPDAERIDHIDRWRNSIAVRLLQLLKRLIVGSTECSIGPLILSCTALTRMISSGAIRLCALFTSRRLLLRLSAGSGSWRG